jgi:hypothetical protein
VTLARPAAFPPVCLSCGRPSSKTWKLTVKRGFNAIMVHHERRLRLPIPLCARCANRRWWGAFLTPAAVVLGVVAGALATAARVADTITPQAQLYTIAAVLVWILVFINFGTRQVDYRVLGVCGIGFDEDSVTLRFRNDAPPEILKMPRPA